MSETTANTIKKLEKNLEKKIKKDEPDLLVSQSPSLHAVKTSKRDSLESKTLKDLSKEKRLAMHQVCINEVIDSSYFGWSNTTMYVDLDNGGFNDVLNNLGTQCYLDLGSIPYTDDLGTVLQLGILVRNLIGSEYLKECGGAGNCTLQADALFISQILLFLKTNNIDDLPGQIVLYGYSKEDPIHCFTLTHLKRDDKGFIVKPTERYIEIRNLPFLKDETLANDSYMAKLQEGSGIYTWEEIFELVSNAYECEITHYELIDPMENIPELADQQPMEKFELIEKCQPIMRRILSDRIDYYLSQGKAKLYDQFNRNGIKIDEAKGTTHLSKVILKAIEENNLDRIRVICRLLVFLNPADSRIKDSRAHLLLFLARQKFLCQENKVKCAEILLQAHELVISNSAELSETDKNLILADIMKKLGELLSDNKELLETEKVSISMRAKLESLRSIAVEKYKSTISPSKNDADKNPLRFSKWQQELENAWVDYELQRTIEDFDKKFKRC